MSHSTILCSRASRWRKSRNRSKHARCEFFGLSYLSYLLWPANAWSFMPSLERKVDPKALGREFWGWTRVNKSSTLTEARRLNEGPMPEESRWAVVYARPFGRFQFPHKLMI